jgi:hypothetical protein
MYLPFHSFLLSDALSAALGVGNNPLDLFDIVHILYYRDIRVVIPQDSLTERVYLTVENGRDAQPVAGQVEPADA